MFQTTTGNPLLEGAVLDSAILDNELLHIWLSRYLPDLGLIPNAARSHFEERLSVVISSKSRQQTHEKIRTHLNADCTMAAIQSQKLISESGQTLQLMEAKELSFQITEVYDALLKLYVEDFVFTPVLESLHTFENFESKMSATVKIVPAFNRLMERLHPLLAKLQAIYATSSNRRAIGFVTTQLHLTRQRLLDRLDAYERLWLTPYLRLVEDFICIPWQRICTASFWAPPERVEMAKKVLLKNHLIASQVYQKALRTYPNHISRQGRIQSAGVQHSSTRDLVMFQAYLWLCVLENDLSSIQDELLPLCILVFPCTQVSWSFVTQGLRWLVEAIQAELDDKQQQIFSLTAAPVEQLFVAADPTAADIESISNNLKLRFAL